MNERNLVITGMMGTGKSSVAQVVAEQLQRTLVDTDVEIEKRFGKKITAIFKTEGEGAFRKAEAELCEELSRTSNLVISTGGGFLLPVRSLKMMDPHTVFCLDASAKTIAQRTKNRHNRPLLFGVSDESAIQQIMNERCGAYQNIFHHVSTDSRSVQRISEEIIGRFALESQLKSYATRFVRMPLVSPYPIVVGDSVALDIPKRLAWAGIKVQRVLIVTNEKLKGLYGDFITESCQQSSLACEWLCIPDGEQYKNLETVQTLYKNLLRRNAKRDDVIIALGGGVVGDVAGFVAATYMRGLRLVQIPTTLLAMVDSSIGGKTGVDLDEGKNLVGAFKQPSMVLADTALLKTLPADEFRSGMAEVIKHAIIDDPALFELLSSDATLSNDELVSRALEVKACVVEEDPFEHGRRALLNLGHTFGHAIEKVSEYKMRHGYAVAVGLLAACELATQLSECEPGLRARVEHVLKRFELPTHVSGMRVDEIVDAMQHDKKGGAKGLRFVVPCDIGDVRLMRAHDVGAVRAAVESVMGN